MNSVSLHTLMEFHARHNCTLTALMVRPPHRDDDSKKKSAMAERDIIGLAEDSKIVYFAAMADLDDDLTLSRHMMKRSVAVVHSTHLQMRCFAIRSISPSQSTERGYITS